MAFNKSAALLATALVIAACGLPDDGSSSRDGSDPVLQVRSEGGFGPVELVLAQGPTYTLLADGRLIFTGPTIAIFPGPLVPSYLVGHVTEADMGAILEGVDEMGLAGITDEHDESNASLVADATTEVVTYWDENGTHVYSVYALGLATNPADPRTAAFADLLTVIDQAAAKVDAVPYEPERVRIIAGVAMAPVDPQFEDIRPWPLGEDDPAGWNELLNGWVCQEYGAEVQDEFDDATQVTQWLHPDPMMDAPPFTLLVRPLHPGEPDCPA